MAKNNKAIARANRNIKNIAKGITGNMDALYRSTYMSSPQQRQDLNDLGDQVNASIDKIVNKNMDTIGIPSVSKLYTRMADGNTGANKVINSLERMFDSGLMTDDLYGVFMSNRYLKELDMEIDTVCKYMTKLEEALAVQKDCVLSADHFSKDFLSMTDNGFSSQTSTVFSERIKDLKKKYQLPKLVEEIYETVAKYGEQFVYRVPYSTAIGKLLATKPDGQLVAPIRGRGLYESSMEEDAIQHENYVFTIAGNKFSIRSEGGIDRTKEFGLNESATSFIEKATNRRTPDGKEVTERVMSPVLQENERFNIAVQINKSGIIDSAVREAQSAFNKKNSFVSMAEMHEHSILTEADNTKNIQAGGNITHNFGSIQDDRFIANDGLVGGEPPKPVKVNAPGCVIKKLQRDHVVPIYIEDICMGYYYFELRSVDNSEPFFGFKNILSDPLTNMRGEGRLTNNSVDNKRQDETIKYIAGQLSSFIDKQFVNNNQDLAKEIYMILKYNDLFNTPSIDLIKVTFVPPEDMTHFYFRQDPITHRGISDLDKALIPAKIYSSLYITNAIGVLTRGQDKRVYYVKQAVDTNIAQTLLNTISQIKQSNFGIRQFQNINNILNITGRFNDYVIPTNASGDPPVTFEVMPGQDINTPTDLMEALEEMAINSTGIPLEIIQARQSVDYAMQLTMSSSKVLRFCYKRQELYEELLTEFISPIYNYEYGTSTTIKVSLPPPSFINVTNTNQLVDNTRNFVQSLVEVELANEQDDQLRNEYTNELLKHYLGTHIDISKHKEILDRCRISVKTKTDESHSSGGGEEY